VNNAKYVESLRTCYDVIFHLHIEFVYVCTTINGKRKL
jgi:hypothetical protein